MPFTAFNRKLGETQGRISPWSATPADGSFVFCLGSDEAGVVEELNANDYAEVSQDADVTDLTIIRARATIRGPQESMPATVYWILSVIVDGVTQSWRVVWPKRTVDLDDLVFYVHGLVGVHTLAVRLVAQVIP